MKRLAALALLFASVNATTAVARQPADVFGWQLDCATKKALRAYSQNISEISRVRRAVDSCMSNSMPNDTGVVRVSMKTTLMALEARREDLVEATMQRLQLCRDAGIGPAKFAAACPQLFSIESIPLD
jgi:hypothetical protein